MLEKEGIEKIKNEKDIEFAERVSKKYQQKSMLRVLRTRVQNARRISYAFQLGSLATMGYFVYDITKDYLDFKFYFALSFLIVLAFGWEIGKRESIIHVFDGAWNETRRWKMWFAPLVVILVAGSITASYIGGDKFVKNETKAPVLVSYPEIDSLNNQIAIEQETVKKLENTTWKGKITRTANKGINLSKERQNTIEQRIVELKQKQDDENEGIINASQERKNSMGFVTGFFSGFMDILVLIFLALAENWETKADKLLRRQTVSAQQQQSSTYQQIPTASQQAAQQPISENKRKIGFEIPENGFVSTQKQVTQANTQKHTRPTQNAESAVARGTQPDTGNDTAVVSPPQKDPDYIIRMKKRIRERWAKSFENHPRARKSEAGRKHLRELALEEWKELEEMGYLIRKDTSLNPWGLEIVSPQKQKRHGLT